MIIRAGIDTMACMFIGGTGELRVTDAGNY